MMDKEQKQLIDTYIRKREIASGEHSYGYRNSTGAIEPYELYFLIKTDRINPKKINSGSFNNNITDLIKYKPEVYRDPDIQKYLGSLTTNNKGNIIANKPEFIDTFKDDINDLSSGSISYILQHQPQLANRFDLNKLNQSHAIQVIEEQPQFVENPIFAKHLKNLVAKGDSLDKTRFWSHLRFGQSYYRYMDHEEENKKLDNKYHNAIVKYPIFRKLFPEKIKEESNRSNLATLLKMDKTLFPYFDLSMTKDYSLYKLLESFPELINKISETQLATIEIYYIKSLLEKQPQLKPHFEFILNPASQKNYGSIRKQIENDSRFAILRQYLSDSGEEVSRERLMDLKKHFNNEIVRVRNNRDYDAYQERIKLIDLLLEIYPQQ